MLQLRIPHLLNNKGINKPYQWLRSIGISHHSCYKLLNRNNNRLRQEHIHIICKHAWCTPNELFEYIANDEVLEAGHPLLNLQGQAPLELFDQILKLSPEKLKAMKSWLEEGD